MASGSSAALPWRDGGGRAVWVAEGRIPSFDGAGDGIGVWNGAGAGVASPSSSSRPSPPSHSHLHSHSSRRQSRVEGDGDSNARAGEWWAVEASVPFGKGDCIVLDVLVVLVAAAGRVVKHPRPVLFHQQHGWGGHGNILRIRRAGGYCFLRMVYSERIVSGPATASVCLESGGLDSDNLPGIMYTIPL